MTTQTTLDTFETERGDKVTLTESPKKCWALGGEDAAKADSLYARWRELRAELAESEGRYVDLKRGVEKLEAEAEESRAQALIDAAVLGHDPDTKTDAKAAKAIETARQDLAATQDRCGILPHAITACASQWAQAAAEVLLTRLHESSPAADELAARIETLIPELTQEWRAFAKEQSAAALGLARICEAVDGKIFTAEMRLLCGQSFANAVGPALQRTDPSITLRGPQRHSITAGAFRSGSLGAGY